MFPAQGRGGCGPDDDRGAVIVALDAAVAWTGQQDFHYLNVLPSGSVSDAALAATDLEAFAGRSARRLSGGEQQRVQLAQALAQDTPVLLLDEPTAHLDIRHQLDLLAVLRDSGATVLVVLHDLNLAAAVCDRIGVLADGALAAAGPPVEVLTEELVARVFGVATRVVRHPDTGAVALLFTLPAHSPDRSGAS